MSDRAWLVRYRRMRTIADRIQRQRTERARRVAAAAGLDPSMPFHHAHNALVARERGRPWRGVDYALAREVRRLEVERWVGHDIVRRWVHRTWGTRRDGRR